MKVLKLNQRGIAHIVVPIAFIAVFAAVGGYLLLRSNAAGFPYSLSGTTYENGIATSGAKVTLHNNNTGTTTTMYSFTGSGDGAANAAGLYGIQLAGNTSYTVKATITGPNCALFSSPSYTFKSASSSPYSHIQNLVMTRVSTTTCQ